MLQQFDTVMYPFVRTAMNVVEDHPTGDAIENDRRPRQSKRPCRRPCNENVGVMNSSSVGDPDGESYNRMVAENSDVVSKSRNSLQVDNRMDVEETDLDGDANIGSLQTIIFQLRGDVGALSKSIQANENLVINVANLEKQIESQKIMIENRDVGGKGFQIQPPHNK
ncbi:hypothetical protein Bhyg_13149 [Pseudolycoriella hygida]|uniref:Uncharacterized protein n=1 Tax=Pseudolycoriella hygida TaxID=35572 RepID=A0A9Q0MP16_9DIPT|nr:hypothetical protein Bhyg_13149 [Pseudolycoriella hygida]